ncbi:MAG TPA: hypothetical protein VJH87_22210 [Vicinamibacteria bacterium]|nr:hypothetical protein [Vicinamibacteria bacterium]
MMKRLLVISVLFMASATSADQKVEEILMVAAAAADIALTEGLLARDADGLAEGNPLMRGGPGVRIGLKAGATVGLILLARHFDHSGNHGLARALRWTTIGAWSSGAGWNVHLGMAIPIQ